MTISAPSAFAAATAAASIGARSWLSERMQTFMRCAQGDVVTSIANGDLRRVHYASAQALRGFAYHAPREVVERRSDVLGTASIAARLACEFRLHPLDRPHRPRHELQLRCALHIK